MTGLQPQQATLRHGPCALLQPQPCPPRGRSQHSSGTGIRRPLTVRTSRLDSSQAAMPCFDEEQAGPSSRHWSECGPAAIGARPGSLTRPVAAGAAGRRTSQDDLDHQQHQQPGSPRSSALGDSTTGGSTVASSSSSSSSHSTSREAMAESLQKLKTSAVALQAQASSSSSPKASSAAKRGSAAVAAPGSPGGSPRSSSSITATSSSGLLSPDETLAEEQPPEIGLVPDELMESSSPPGSPPGSPRRKAAVEPPVPLAPSSAEAAAAGVSTTYAPASTAATAVALPQPKEEHIRDSWTTLMRWSRWFRSRQANSKAAKDRLEKVVVFGGGSFGTAMGVCLARQHPETQVVLLLRDPYLCREINESHCNTRYLKDFTLPPNVTATTSAPEAIQGAQCAIHAVPVQHSRVFLDGIKHLIHPKLPIISVSKGVEVSTGHLMSDLIPSVLGKKHPTAYMSGPSFAREVMDDRPTGITVASKDKNLALTVQALFASPTMRVNTSTDVVGVEVCGALKNVLAIAAGIVEGMGLGHNAMAALVAQGCSEIRWLTEKMGGKTATVSGLSGLGDIMLTCYGSLSRNRSVGVRLGRGEQLEDILASSSQVAEGVATAGVVVSLARKYRVQLPVLTAVAQVVNGHISAREAVYEIMNLPQTEER